MDKSIRLHIGLPKTATSFVQKDVISKIKNINSFVHPNFGLIKKNDFLDGSTLNAIFRRSPYIWKDLGDEFFGCLKEKSDPEKKLTFISDELILVGDRNDPVVTSEHIKRMKRGSERHGYNNFEVVVTIRKQDEWLASAYSETSEQYFGVSQSSFETWVIKRIDKKDIYHRSSGIRINYNLMYNSIKDILGESNTVLVPYEMLKEDPKKFVSKIIGTNLERIKYKFKNEKRNKGNTKDDKWILKKPNRSKWIKINRSSFREWIDLGLSFITDKSPFREREIKITQEIKESVMESYGPENKKLSEKIDIDLENYGYF
jgi:hypothetical protein